MQPFRFIPGIIRTHFFSSPLKIAKTFLYVSIILVYIEKCKIATEIFYFTNKINANLRK